jgi:predicted ArsR family transcriptional regulator
MTKRVGQTSRASWDLLTPEEKEIREKSLRVLSLMRRKGISLSEASGIVGVSPMSVVQHTGALVKSDNRWIARPNDSIERVMLINEAGRSKYIKINDSELASLIGRYHAAVRKFLEKGDSSVLEPFARKEIMDSSGEVHKLDTDPTNLYEIHEAREEEEFYSIYRS